MGLYRKQRDTLARGTSREFVHELDLPITRANIESVQQQRIRDGKATLSPGGIVRLFVHFPQERHIARVTRLMRGA